MAAHSMAASAAERTGYANPPTGPSLPVLATGRQGKDKGLLPIQSDRHGAVLRW